MNKRRYIGMRELNVRKRLTRVPSKWPKEMERQKAVRFSFVQRKKINKKKIINDKY